MLTFKLNLITAILFVKTSFKAFKLREIKETKVENEWNALPLYSLFYLKTF